MATQCVAVVSQVAVGWRFPYTSVATFMYGTNFGLARLELKWLWMLRRSLPEMVQRVSKTEQDRANPEPALSRGERRHVGAVRKRKFGVPRFVAGNKNFQQSPKSSTYGLHP